MLSNNKDSQVNRRLKLMVMGQQEAPGFQMCSLTTADWRLTSLSEVEAEAIARTFWRLSNAQAAALVWTCVEAPQGPLPTIRNARKLQQQNQSDSEQDGPYVRLFAEVNELAETLRTVWNHFDLVQIYPVNSEADIDSFVRLHVNKHSDEAMVGLDWENKWYLKQERTWLALIGGLCGTIWFTVKLFFSRQFRKRLLDPFQQKSMVKIVAERGVYMCKGGHDEAVELDFMTSACDAFQVAEQIFTSAGIRLEVCPMKRPVG